MILVICGTNREHSLTSIVAKHCLDYLEKKGLEVKYFTLEDLPIDFAHSQMYSDEGMHPELANIQNEFIFPAKKWLVVSPEYNGSFPGILKLFFDAISVRKYPKNFKGKKVGMIGLASGRAGNLRGMDDMTGFMHYLKMDVYPNKLPLSMIEQSIVNNKLKPETIDIINEMLDGYIKW
jgi:NAD(P)H-dependent FMN reductase